MSKVSENSKITKYFQSKKKIEWIDVPIVQAETSTEHFYEESISERIVEAKCAATDCANRKLELRNKLKEEQEKLENLKKALASCQFIIEEKNKKISQLQSTAKKKKTESDVTESSSKTTPNTPPKTPPKPPPETTATTASPVHTQPKKDTSESSLKTPPAIRSLPTSFSSFDEHFSSNQLAQLRSFGSTIRDDSKFILLVMRSLYQNDLNELKGIKLALNN